MRSPPYALPLFAVVFSVACGAGPMPVEPRAGDDAGASSAPAAAAPAPAQAPPSKTTALPPASEVDDALAECFAHTTECRDWATSLVAKEPERAQFVFAALCRKGDEAACVQVGTLYLNSTKTSAPLTLGLEEAAPFYKKGCASGTTALCVVLGLMTMRGHGVPKDENAGATLINKACAESKEPVCVRIRKEIGAPPPK